MTTSELKGIFLPVQTPIGEPVDSVLRTDPWFRDNPKMTPQEYTRRRVEFAASTREDSSIRPAISSTVPLFESTVLRTWLLNDVLSLSASDIDIVLAALEDPINELVDPLANEQDRRERRAYVQAERARLQLIKAKR